MRCKGIFSGLGYMWLAGVLAFAQSSSVSPLVTRAVDDSQLTVLRGNTHPLAKSAFDRGPAPADLPMERMLLVLKRSPQQQRALTRLLDQQQDKASPNYRQWLTPEQFGEQFGPVDSDLLAVNSWLQSHGFRVNQISAGRTIIEFSGTASQVQEAFHTPIHRYVVSGVEHWANAGDPQIPKALEGVVAGAATLHNFHKKPLVHVSPQRIAAKYDPAATPHTTFSGGLHALSPADYATIYNIKPLHQAGINGAGRSIAVVARSDIDFNDVYDFYWVFQAPRPSIQYIANGPAPGNLGGGEEVEAILDTTWAGVVAPGATIYFVTSASTNTTDGVDLSELYIVDHNLADVMTESFGSCEAFYTQAEADFVSALAQQAAAQGITYLVSAGDSGASGCDYPTSTQASGPLSVNLLASSPYNIAVGGTIFNEHGQNATYWNTTNDPNTGGSARTYIPENAWNESCTVAQCGADNAGLWAGGGGVSEFFAKPSWQAGVAGIPNDGMRDLPDVSLTAAGHDPYLLCFERSCVPDNQGFVSFIGVSGTSASAPSFAGIMALINQKTGSRQGQANYVLYRLAAGENLSQCNASKTTGAPASTCIFYDVTTGNIAVPGQAGYGTSSGKYQAATGYDMATGLGSVNVNNLANQWNTVTFNSTTTTLNLNPTTITHGSPVTVDIAVAPASGTGTPSGDASLIASLGQGVDVFTLSAGSVSSTTNVLPGGTYDITAHYAGDSTYGASDSDPVSVTVSAEGSATTLSVLTADQSGNAVPFTSGPYGSFVYLRADVAGQSGFGTASGILYFADGANPIVFTSLNSEGSATTPQGVTWLSPGPHSLSAFYYGDGSFNSSTSPSTNVSISQAPTTITVAADRTSVGHGASVALSATIRTNSYSTLAPQGTVTFLSGSTVLGSTGLLGSTDPNTGTATAATFGFASSDLPVGQNNVTARYEGDTNYTVSTSAPVVINVLAEFAISLDQSTVTIARPGQSGTVTLTVTGEPEYNGTVNFAAASCRGLPRESTCSFNPASITGSGTTAITISTTAPHTAAVSPMNRSIYFAFWSAGGGALLAVVFLLPAEARRRRSRLLTLVLAGFLVAATSCGGGGDGGGRVTDPGTPSGSSIVTVTATSGTLTHTATFTLTVQ